MLWKHPVNSLLLPGFAAISTNASPTIEPQPSPSLATRASLQSPIVGKVCPKVDARYWGTRNVAILSNVSTAFAARLIAGLWVDTSFFHDPDPWTEEEVEGRIPKETYSLIHLLSTFPALTIPGGVFIINQTVSCEWDVGSCEIALVGATRFIIYHCDGGPSLRVEMPACGPTELFAAVVAFIIVHPATPRTVAAAIVYCTGPAVVPFSGS